MVSIIGKQMIFPNEEQTFIMGDSGSTSRTFILDRYDPDRIDLAGLTFRLDIRYKSGEKNTALLIKSVQEDKITLLWDVIKADFREERTVFIAIRAYDETGAVKWNSAATPIFAERAIDTPGNYDGDLSELEQMEQRISAVLDREAAREAAEEKRQEAEEGRETAEGERTEAEHDRQEAEEQRRNSGGRKRRRLS